MIGEAIILAGGLGTRLRTVVSDIPKCMAPVCGKPFLYYVIAHLVKQGIEKFIFSLGYKSELIIDYLNDQYPGLNKQYSIEEEPLGTGGAIQLACKLANNKNVLVVNGDTLFKIDVNAVSGFHLNNGAACTLSLKPMLHFNRYGVVELNNDHRITSFKEKQAYDSGLINAGIYALNVQSFLQEELPQVFSFEKEYLEVFYTKRMMYGLAQDAYFIDIGIPEDYKRAQEELKISGPGQVTNSQQNQLDLTKIDKTWTLFLDRDGVINHEKHNDYIHQWEEFNFYEGVKEAIAVFAGIFNRIIVVTNQKGIGKGVTRLADVERIHNNMIAEIEKAAGRIDAVYFCPDLEDTSPNRKPNPGMGLQAAKDYPDVDLTRAIMIGNTISDMQFGRNLGIHTIFLPSTRPDVDLSDPQIDAVYGSLSAFAADLKNSS